MSSNNGTETPAPTSAPASSAPASSAPASSAPASSAPVSVAPSSAAPAPSSSADAPVSSAPPASSAPASSQQPAATSVVTASAAPPSTQIITSFVTPVQTNPTITPTPSLVIVTSVYTPSATPVTITGSATTGKSSSSTAPATVQTSGGASQDKGLNTGGRTAIAVVIPIVVVAALVVGGIFLWRRRKQRKNAEDERRKEVEEYGYNPNNDPTLPAVAVGGSEMAEDSSGYRGWGNTTSSNRKASTTLTSGWTGGNSDNGSQPGGYHSPGSPTQGTHSDGHSNDPLVNGRRETMDEESFGALGAGPSTTNNRSDINRGPSNASSSYSAGNRSDNSGEYPLPNNPQQDYYGNEAGYYQPGPYEAYNGQQPVIRDVSARRNTRIENPSVFPQQGNSGIAQNF